MKKLFAQMKPLACISIATAVVAVKLDVGSQATQDDLWDYLTKSNGQEDFIDGQHIPVQEDFDKLFAGAAKAGVHIPANLTGQAIMESQGANVGDYPHEGFYRIIIVDQCKELNPDEKEYCEEELLPNLEKYVADVKSGKIKEYELEEGDSQKGDETQEGDSQKAAASQEGDSQQAGATQEGDSKAIDVQEAQEDLAKLMTGKSGLLYQLTDLLTKMQTMAATLTQTQSEYRSSAKKTKQEAGEMAKQAQRTKEIAEKERIKATKLAELAELYTGVATASDAQKEAVKGQIKQIESLKTTLCIDCQHQQLNNLIELLKGQQAQVKA